jgi:hypothetical protein
VGWGGRLSKGPSQFGGTSGEGSGCDQISGHGQLSGGGVIGRFGRSQSLRVESRCRWAWSGLGTLG